MAQSVLAIDDSPEIHDLLKVRLRPEGLVLHHATDAAEGMRKARELQPDLILLDVDMPEMSGYEVCKRLKDDPQTASLQVIFLSGDAESRAKVQGLDLGATDYVTKPFEPSELRARVRAALRTKRYLDLLAARAQLDGLTGLWNRAYFDRRLDEELMAARRYLRMVSLVMIDLDHFKRLNDTYGHPTGDRVLQSMGEVLLGSMRASDAPCRYGGEEFAVILTETGNAGALQAAERIQLELARLRFRHGASSFGVTASIGVASTELFADPEALSRPLLLRAADEALYVAKRSGRNQICQARNAALGEPRVER